MYTHLTRAELLAQRGYDKHRDGPDALTAGTRTVMRPYTGSTAIGTGELKRDQEMFAMRTGDTCVPDWRRIVLENARERTVPAGKWDWDCHKCHTSVITDVDDPTCPNCLL